MAPKMCLKLLIDKENNRVIFAEAGRDFLESISGIGFGCFPHLSQSVTNCLKTSLDSEFRICMDCYFKRDEAGCLPCGCKCGPLLKETTTNISAVYTYIITDDLVFTPASAFKAFTILREFQVNSFETLEERTLYVGTKKITSILLTSFRSKVVLTDVFLSKKMLSREALKFLDVEEEDDDYDYCDEDNDDDEDDDNDDGDDDSEEEAKKP